MIDLSTHVCSRDERRPLYDARMIFCSYVCDRCEKEKRARFRPEIFEDPNYEHAEPLDDD